MSAITGARRWRWLAIGMAVVAVLAVGGPFVYIHLVEGNAPKPLAVTSSSPGAQAGGPTSPAGSAAGIDGIWKAASGSQAGYRVDEVLFGQNSVAVGRTSQVSGQLTIQGSTVSAADLTVDLSSVQSDRTPRDNQFRGRIMDTATYPTASFKLASPIRLGSVPAQGATVSAKAAGQLTLRGTTRTVTTDLTARRSGGSIQVSGEIPVTFSDWGIPNPSFGPVTTEDHGTIEYLVVFDHA
ncbi:MAG TPA: YceI family protein [Actinomycetes bacterium]